VGTLKQARTVQRTSLTGRLVMSRFDRLPGLQKESFIVKTRSRLLVPAK